MAMHEVKVLVPEERLADFYARFGAWLAASGAALTGSDAEFDEEDTVEKGKSTAKSWGARTDSGAESRTASRTGTHPTTVAGVAGTHVRTRSDSEPSERSPQERFAGNNGDRGMEAAWQASDRVGSQDDDLLDGAIEWWRSLKRNERDIFTLFMDAAPQTMGAAEIVTKLGLKSERVIPGVLAWPRRKAARAGFPLAWKFEHDPDGKARYGLRNMPEVSMSAIEYAALMREAKRTVEG